MNTQRVVELDRLKGIAIFFVVLGHLERYPQDDGVVWYFFLKSAIYSFHMPLFVWTSGFIAAYTYRAVMNWTDYKRYLAGKAVRLVPAYLIVSALVLLGKFLMQDYIYVDNPVSGWSDLFDVLIKPQESPAGFIWYIYVLLEYFIAMPLLMLVLQCCWPVLLVVGIVLCFLDGPSHFALILFFQFFFFFSLGLLTYKYQTVLFDLARRYGSLLFVAFVVLIGVNAVNQLPKLLVGIVAIPAFYWFVADRPWQKLMGVFELLGVNVFTIYLLSMFFIGLVKGVSFSMLGLSYNEFWIIAPIMVLAGIAGPIYTKRHILVRCPSLYRLLT